MSKRSELILKSAIRISKENLDKADDNGSSEYEVPAPREPLGVPNARSKEKKNIKRKRNGAERSNVRKRYRNALEWIDTKAETLLNQGVEHKNRKGRIIKETRYVKEIKKKQVTVGAGLISRRLNSRNYSFKIINEEELKVCKSMFLNTLGISETYVTTALSKIRGSSTIIADQREKHNNRPERIKEAIKDSDITDIGRWKTDENKKDFKIGKIREISVKSSVPVTIFFKYEYDSADSEILKIRFLESEKRGRPPKANNSLIIPNNLKRLYNTELPVEEKKLKGLLWLCDKNKIPKMYHQFYRSLKCKKASEDGEDEELLLNE
ncbi:unnamed protein product [Psylliodes chrysocephalus]|uniref:Uncharacterized protein n=1 Tax=Psylliodes chrysocephalus TaxID=3402493 RepID=A0A9P0D303_9CUCU|nr:unnamed protein product [Psylliodes chrysocephala]